MKKTNKYFVYFRSTNRVFSSPPDSTTMHHITYTLVFGFIYCAEKSANFFSLSVIDTETTCSENRLQIDGRLFS